MNNIKYLTLKGASEACGVCENTLRNWMRSGRLVYRKHGPVYLLDPVDIERAKQGYKRKCAGCGKEFYARRRDQLYHDMNCRRAASMRRWRASKHRGGQH